jgi:exodeoxyribonuclease VII small subunit
MTDADRAEPTSDADASFEALFARLEAITAQLESGDLPLERSVELYAEGMRVAERCQQLLSGVEQRVEQLREAYDRAAPGSLL